MYVFEYVKVCLYKYVCSCIHSCVLTCVYVCIGIICYMGMREVYVILGSMRACVFASISVDVCMGCTCMYVHG